MSPAVFELGPDASYSSHFLMLVAGDEAVTSPITIVQNWDAGPRK